ncbi:AAA family ATPase [Streptomyces sp. FXJ1.172]|uniref:helix-turn-helix transcriptional regulator n=1 Tax=Streptomyces sp. FXJ1.172 TaxID=710705 RepID=UPI0008364B15|nr:LuxR family transcriptional regulator [Streptomyces sp. FXJ1.172]WEO97602.1 AAA family ATPase [Streptomyces sp. FXJ1.172]
MQGRDEELRRIELLLAGARCGESGALLLHGEAGIGKTALLEHAAARADGLRVLRVEGIESEMELGFSGLHQFFLPVLHMLDRLPGPQAQALRSVFGLVDAPVQDRLTVALAALSVLAEAAADTPLLCLVDDLQWLDQPSADVLTFAARRLRAEGVVMLFAARGDSPGSTARALPRLHVTGIDRTAAAALLPGLAPHVAERVIDQARGNPLALRELSAALTPAQRSGQLGPLAMPDGPPALPSRLQEALAEQIHHLPHATRRILAVAAADDTGDLNTVLAAAARLGGAVEDLAPAERAGLLAVSRAGLRFRHPLVRFAAYRGAPLAERIAAHRALAKTLDGAGQAHRRAWHLAAAATGPDERVAAELERVAEWAGSRQAMASASAAYERAAQLTSDPALRARRLIGAAQRASEAGQDERCAALAGQVPQPLRDVGMAADFARLRAVVELGFGSPAQAARLLAESADATAAQRPDKIPVLLTDALHAAFAAGDATLITQIAARSPDLPVLAVPAYLFADAAAAGPRKDGRAATDGVPTVPDVGAVRGAQRPLRELVAACGRARADLMDQLMTGHYCHLLADHGAAHQVATAAVVHCRDRGVGGWLPTTLHLLAQVELALGRRGDALAHATEALRLADYYDLDHRVAHLRALLAVLAAARGEQDHTRELADRALEYTRPRGVGRGTSDALWALGLLDLGSGQAQRALDRLEAAREAAGHPLLARHLLPDLVEAAVRAGHPERAKAPAEALAACADALGQAAVSAQSRRCTALTAPTPRAEEHYLAALGLHPADDSFERARTELLYGEWLRRQRRKLDARDRLHAALEHFDRVGAQPWSRRARTELRAAGEHHDPALAADSPLARLSPQEREVVRLAATGATNREIATQLLLSPRTVGHHLYRAFPKLGIGSRTQLADLLGG